MPRCPDDDRRAFLTGVAESFGPDLGPLAELARAFADDPTPAAAAELAERAEPARQDLIRRLNHAPGGTLALVRLREDLIEFSRDDERLKLFDHDFQHLFASWFNRGFLTLRRIDWTTPANILEKIIRYEAVHAIDGWADLRRRLEPPDRRLYAFFHPALGDEPLIFVEVALTAGIPDAIQPLLARERVSVAPSNATTAVFYSISNAQRGLAGVSFGNFLIKQVAEDLKREWPKLASFVTLSPVPGFVAWLKRERAKEDSTFIDAETRRSLALTDHEGWETKAQRARGRQRASFRHWPRIISSRRKDHHRRPLDPVARFHLGNGARLERMQPQRRCLARGLTQSLGLMVNYLYDLDEIEQNHEAYANRGEIAAAPAIRRLATPARAEKKKALEKAKGSVPLPEH